MHASFAYLLVTPDCLRNQTGEAITLPLIWNKYILFGCSAAGVCMRDARKILPAIGYNEFAGRRGRRPLRHPHSHGHHRKFLRKREARLHVSIALAKLQHTVKDRQEIETCSEPYATSAQASDSIALPNCARNNLTQACTLHLVLNILSEAKGQFVQALGSHR